MILAWYVSSLVMDTIIELIHLVLMTKGQSNIRVKLHIALFINNNNFKHEAQLPRSTPDKNIL